MRKKITYITMISLILIGIIFFLYFNKSNKTLITITTNKYSALLKEEEYMLVYAGRPTCPDCDELQPELETVLKNNELKAYYWNTDKAKKESMDTFNAMKENQNISHVPIIIQYKDNKEVDRYEYQQFKESKESLDEFIEKYKSGIN